MIIDKVLQAADPYLKDRVITDAVFGISLIGVEFDNGHYGLSYMLRESLPAGCSVFGFGQEIIGMNAADAAVWAKTGENDAKKGAGIAVLTAASRALDIPDEPDTLFFGLDIQPEDTVGLIGWIPPVGQKLKEHGCRLIAFDEGISLRGGNPDIYPMEKQAELLPQCDVLIATGTTVTNGTIEGILPLTEQARDIVLVGSSVPMFSEAFEGTNISVLAGSWWDLEAKEEVFRRIRLAGGIRHVGFAMQKKSAVVKRP